jgi:co-chaperonin GroES (HSP10)
MQMETKEFDSIVATSTNILVKVMSNETKTSGGIVLPDSQNDKTDIQKGIVVETGPGFMIPPLSAMTESSSIDEDILKEVLGKSSQIQVKYISLDINKDDIIFYIKESASFVRLDGIEFAIVPYGAVKLIGKCKYS